MRTNKRLVSVSCIAALFSLSQASAWADEQPKDKALEKITVTGEAMEESNQSFTVNTVYREQLEQRNISDVLRAIEETAGMTMSTGAFAQGGVASAFQIRGFAEGGHGSDAAVYIDGISLNEGGSHGDGFADTNVIMPIELETISVFKGPVSPLYGNFARAGTLAFETRKGGEYQEADLFVGAYDTVNTQFALGQEVERISTNFALQAYDSSGYREHQDYTKINATGRIAYEIANHSDIALSVRHHHGHFNSPGYVTEEQFYSGEAGRKGRAPTAENDGGDRDFISYRVDYNTMLTDDIRLLAYGYGVHQDSVRFAKFSYTEQGQTERNYSRDGMALGVSLNGDSPVLGKAASWVIGLEYLDETTDAARYNSKDRVRGEVTQNRELTTETTSLFGQLDLAVTERFTTTIGGRFDHFDGEALDRITGLSSTMQDYAHFSPKLGMRYALSTDWQVRGSVANGFALPAGEAKYDASIQVDPIDYLQYEIGIYGTPLKQLSLDLAAFRLDSDGEYQQIGGETVNFGETQRSGLEAEVRYSLTEELEFLGLLGVFDSEIKKGANPGKEITSVPQYTATLKASYSPSVGLGGSIAWRSTGEYFLTGDNSQSYAGFDVVDMTMFYHFDHDGAVKLYAQVNNLLDETYAEAVWYGDSGNFAPAAGRNLGVGVTIKM
ncbi:TonB-dependent receptor [Planctobacterium marinum]|uniref:TonB-dependent receptor n=1 Tax=Planctobacterium marinum TaxID=1631968 RepID=UPI001E3DEAA8|nr:TonB-dependent receptor [Planctobacterium marinum]MCC2605231.1 TonB-dependent receptor [Planctobacterium marinum]